MIPEIFEIIQAGNVNHLAKVLHQNPELMFETASWPGTGTTYGSGGLLHMAATANQPEIIKFLIVEKKLDPNMVFTSGDHWTGLIYAQHAKAYDAAAMLLQLGADPKIKNQAGDKDAVTFCASEEVQKRMDPEYLEKVRQEKIAGKWICNTTAEIVHEYELPDSGYHLTDVFNFETRCMRSIVSIDGGGLAQSMVFFDDMPEKEMVRQALEKLQEANPSSSIYSVGHKTLAGKKSILS